MEKNESNKKILIVYFSNHDTEDQFIFFNGTIGEFRDEIEEKDFNFFNVEDRFKIRLKDEESKTVKVVKVKKDLMQDGRSGGDKYYICPEDLETEKINFDNLTF